MTSEKTHQSSSIKEESAPPSSDGAGFTFFNISHPSEARSSQYRRKVRSNVTKQQHRVRKPHTTAKSFRPFQPDAKTGLSLTRQEIVAIDSPESQEFQDAVQSRVGWVDESWSSTNASQTPTVASSSSTTTPDAKPELPSSSRPRVQIKRERVITPPELINSINSESTTSVTNSGFEKRRKISLTFINETGHSLDDHEDEDISPGQANEQAIVRQPRTPSPEKISVAQHDPFNCFTVPWQPWYDGLLHYMMTVFAPRAWPTLKITSAEGMKWETFMTQHAMEEPALFYVRLLFASGELVQVGSLRRERSHWLQAQAIAVINEALSDPKRSISDGLILAVGRIALHECMYGNRDAATHMHRPAQKRMIDLRGGMKQLDFPPLVKRLMRWSDRVMSMYGNTERMIPDKDDDDEGTYDLKQSLNAFEVWAPEPGKALRKRIAIDDLVN
ncbi:unnamed protein product [Cercospora beticola]|nr:unnamed protein product [Cercospora beticola]